MKKKRTVRGLHRRCTALLCGAVLACLVYAGCDTATYENASLAGCFNMNNEIFNRLWFDGVGEFVELYWTPYSGTVPYGGTYQVSQNQLYLEYYSYDPEWYELYIYSDGFTLDGTPYYYAGDECL